jgi:hypothetical protein
MEQKEILELIKTLYELSLNDKDNSEFEYYINILKGMLD